MLPAPFSIERDIYIFFIDSFINSAGGPDVAEADSLRSRGVMVPWPQALHALMFSSSFSTWVLLMYLKLKLCIAFFLLFSTTFARVLGCSLNLFPKLCSLMSCVSLTM